VVTVHSEGVCVMCVCSVCGGECVWYVSGECVCAGVCVCVCGCGWVCWEGR